MSKIVSGQLDVDRLDYLLRDSHYAGVTYGLYDIGRIIDQLAIVDNKFVVLEGGYEVVEQLIFARYQMYQQVYFHKTKRAFELMLQKCGQILKENKMLEIPTLDDLKTEKGQEEYLKCDSLFYHICNYFNFRWIFFIINFILEPPIMPYYETYSPSTYRKPEDTGAAGPDNSVKVLEPIQKALTKKLQEIGIADHEFLTDVTERSPYNLVPDYIAEQGDDDPESNAIRIFYKHNHYSEPIEKRSHIVFTLAANKPHMMRGFVIPEKYELVKKYLKDTFDYLIPEREI